MYSSVGSDYRFPLYVVSAQFGTHKQPLSRGLYCVIAVYRFISALFKAVYHFLLSPYYLWHTHVICYYIDTARGCSHWPYYMLGYTTYFILKILFGPNRAARLRRGYRKSAITTDLVCTCIVVGCFLGFILHGLTTDYDGSDVIYHAEAATTTEPVGREVRIEVRINWTTERIDKEIRDTFPEDPETAIKVARCENAFKSRGGYDAGVQSGHTLSYGRERSYGIFQIHAVDWDQTALKLGYDNYKTDPGDNIKMARYIYDKAGKKWRDWTCYTKKMI